MAKGQDPKGIFHELSEILFKVAGKAESANRSSLLPSTIQIHAIWTSSSQITEIIPDSAQKRSFGKTILLFLDFEGTGDPITTFTLPLPFSYLSTTRGRRYSDV